MKSIILHYLLLVFLYILGTFGISELLSKFLKIFDTDSLPKGLDNAGKWIGYLERSLVLSFLLIHQYSLIGFILTVKAIYRYGDINGDNSEKMKLSEYFIIGTLASLLLTIFLYQLYLELTGYIDHI